MHSSISTLPWITPDLAGTGGTIKTTPEDFVVEEMPLYEPCGSGEHVYVCVRRTGWTTRELADRLAAIAGIDPRAVGFAGLKDKAACVTQTFSLPLAPAADADLAQRISSTLPVVVLDVRRHTNKLRVGHLRGNRFQLVIAGTGSESLARAQDVARAVVERGLPNFYGAQRMGADGKNVERGRRLLDGTGSRRGRAASWAERLLLSAYQASLFNAWLVERMRRGWFAEILRGDVAKRLDSGALFDAEDAAAETARLTRGEITHTGPMYGSKMRWPSDASLELERQVLRAAGIDEAALKGAALQGTRRPGRVLPRDLDVAAHARGLCLSFVLPKGSYATILAREFTKTDGEGAHTIDEVD